MIANLRFEVPIDLIVKNKKICTYRVDATYDLLDPDYGRVLRTVFEEVKGFVTADYVIKRKLFEALMGKELSVIQIGNALPEFDDKGVRKRDADNKPVRSTKEWMRQTWADRIPE